MSQRVAPRRKSQGEERDRVRFLPRMANSAPTAPKPKDKRLVRKIVGLGSLFLLQMLRFPKSQAERLRSTEIRAKTKCPSARA
jgi:hypothetical protein